MKTLFTFLIPAYNGEPFLNHSIHSLISERMIEEKLTNSYEIIIINDGSKDNTKEIATSIAEKWNSKIRDNFIRVINKKNGQYGSVINKGLKEANGIYIKVLDCDDTLHTESLIKLIYIAMSLEKQVDVILTDFTMEKVGTNQKILNSIIKYVIPYKVLNLAKQKLPNDLMTMHSFIYRTDFLKSINYKQIEGVYYSDSQYALMPFLKAKTLYYANLPLYRYYIGHNEQSINMKNMVKNRMHQVKVFEKILTNINFDTIKSNTVKKYSYMVIRRMVQWQILLISFDKSIKNRRDTILQLFNFIKKNQKKNYKKIIKGLFFVAIKITRGFAMPTIIKIGAKIYAKFNKNILAEWN